MSAVATVYTGQSVEFRDVSKRFGSALALDQLSLRIAAGELLALLGPSGCGKTTALRLLAGFDHPTSGTITVAGTDVSRVSAHRRDMGMVFQSYSLFPTMTARDNVAFGLRLRRHDPGHRTGRAGELLDLVGLSEHTSKYPHQLSGGQQQRVALARALAIEPKVLLLDEPLSALDAKVREQLRDEIRRLQLDLGVTTLFVTHDQEEALSIADRVAVMRAGRLEQCASPAQLYDRPATAFVASFVGTMNHLPGHAGPDGRVTIGRQTLAVLGDPPTPNRPVTALVRPEALHVTVDPGGDSVVTVLTFRGPTTRVHLDRADGTQVLADIPSRQARDLPPGSRATITLPDVPVLLATTAGTPTGSASRPLGRWTV